MNRMKRALLCAPLLFLAPSCDLSDYSLGTYSLPPWPDAGWQVRTDDAGETLDAGDAAPASPDASDAATEPARLKAVRAEALVLWLRADVGIELGDDGRIVNWTDMLTGNVATAPSAEARPTLVDDPPALSFDGDDELELPPIPALSSFTFLGVVAAEEQTYCPSILHFSNRDVDESTTDELEFGRHMGTWYYETEISHVEAPPDAFPVGAAHRLGAVQHEDGLAELFVDGVLVSSGTVPLPPAVERSRNFVGNSHWERAIDGSCTPFEGRIFELMFFTGALTEAERLANDAYLEQRWSAALAQ